MATALRGEDILAQSPAPRAVPASQATVVEQSRAVAEVQGALVVAQQRPRDKMRALDEALESCRTKEVAESAFFKFKRGGQSVAGETIHLARELARCWGNILYTVAELDRDDMRRRSEMVAFAWDLETNAQARLTFIVPHVRDTKEGHKPITDMRDIYENNANMGARRLRECIFAVLPPYLTKAAAEQCHLTLQGGTDEKPLPVRIAEALAAFEAIGIGRDRIEAKLGPTARFTPVDLANLRVSYGSIKRGEIHADDEFPRIDGLTGQQLVDQAANETDPESPAEVSPHETAGETHNTPDDHPSRQAAAEIVSKLKRATKLERVDEIMGDAVNDIVAMPDDVKAELDEAVSAAKARLGGE